MALPHCGARHRLCWGSLEGLRAVILRASSGELASSTEILGSPMDPRIDDQVLKGLIALCLLVPAAGPSEVVQAQMATVGTYS